MVPSKNRIAAGGEIANLCLEAAAESRVHLRLEAAAESRVHLQVHAARLVARAVDVAAAGVVSAISTRLAVVRLEI